MTAPASSTRHGGKPLLGDERLLLLEVLHDFLPASRATVAGPRLANDLANRAQISFVDRFEQVGFGNLKTPADDFCAGIERAHRRNVTIGRGESSGGLVILRLILNL